MLKELANEIIEILSESEAKDIRIAELENENTELKEAINGYKLKNSIKLAQKKLKYIENISKNRNVYNITFKNITIIQS